MTVARLAAMTTGATLHLQAIGTVPAIPLSEVRAGDVLAWNFGQISEVVSVIPVTARTVELTTRTKDGTLWTQRKRGSTLVARVAR
jgi:hypothetical protein